MKIKDNTKSYFILFIIGILAGVICRLSDLLPYEENADTNEQNYVIKIELDSESENFINLEEDMNQKFSIILGYREVK